MQEMIRSVSTASELRPAFFRPALRAKSAAATRVLANNSRRVIVRPELQAGGVGGAYEFEAETEVDATG